MKSADTASQSGNLMSASGYFGPEASEPQGELDAELREQIDAYAAEHPGGQERLIPLLHLVQARLGWLPVEAQEYVADTLGMSPIQVFGVVSFYHFFATSPRGKYQIKVCTGTACFVRRAMDLIEELEKQLEIKVGEVSEDHKFGIEQVRCIGACGLAPAMLVNDQVYGNLDKKKVRSILRKIKKAEAAEAAGAEEGAAS